MTEADSLIKVIPIFGRVELRSWIEYDPVRERFIGMGQTKEYDKDGALVRCDISPTGVEAWFDKPDPPWWKRLFA